MINPDFLYPMTTARDGTGQLSLSGLNLVRLAEEYGTPLYVYDAATVRKQAEDLRTALHDRYPGEAEVCYAAKAFFPLQFARHVRELGLGIDVVSLGELVFAKKAGFDPDRVHLHGNNKFREEIDLAIEWGIHAIVVDNLDELEFIESRARLSSHTVKIWLRVTPGIEVHTHPYIQTAHTSSKFGLSVQTGDAALGIRRAMNSSSLDLTGLHTHLGSQIFDAEPYQKAMSVMLSLAKECGFMPREVSSGGGWGVPYTPEDDAPDIHKWIDAVSQPLQDSRSLPRLVLEPGRWLVARAGMAIYSVGSSKLGLEGVPVVAVDGGMADNPRPALYHAGYTACIAERPDETLQQTVRVVGKFCESGDELIAAAHLPMPRRGEHLVMPVAGAYQMSMASNYNLAARPTVLWLDGGRVEVLQKRVEAYEDPWWIGD